MANKFVHIINTFTGLVT